MSNSIFRVHPALGIARVGSSPDFYLAPETAAGERLDHDLFGGLPIKPGTENTPITEEDFRDAQGLVKRQAARFRIYRYPAEAAGSYPTGQGEEVTLGSVIDGKTVVDIRWTVHLANKKLNNYSIETNGQDLGLPGYEDGQTPPLRNANFENLGDDPSNPERLRKLVIDPGPRALSATSGMPYVSFNSHWEASYVNASGEIVPVCDYPKSFPCDSFPELYQPLGALDSLGDAWINRQNGRLVVAGGFGRVAAIMQDGIIPPLTQPTENGPWFDDASDGPVNAVLVFDDSSTQSVHGGWVVVGDPGYAPQTRNVVSVWDDVYDIWVRELDLVPDLYSGGVFQPDYQPSFPDDIQPILHAAMLQRWNTGLPDKAIQGHDMIGAIQPTDDPTSKIPDLTQLIRNPNSATDLQTGAPLMPLSLGDSQKSFLTVSPTQYFFLSQWHGQRYQQGAGAPLGAGEKLDQVSLANCLGGRYSPGIEVSFPIRDTHLYITNWQAVGSGPFRIREKPLDYSTVQPGQPFLTVGYVPLRDAPVEPGDVSKFMSVPWHTDYNSCAVHQPSPNPPGNNTLFWSWPAERPVSVHPVGLCQYDADSNTWILGRQVFSIRGELTETDYPANAGRFQVYMDFLLNWEKVGFVIQATQIATDQPTPLNPGWFLEVSSQFSADAPPPVFPWPTANIPKAPGTT